MINKLLFFMIFAVSPVWAQTQNFDLIVLTELPKLPLDVKYEVNPDALPKNFPKVFVKTTSEEVGGDAATSFRVYEEGHYEITKVCNIHLNIDKPVWDTYGRPLYLAFLKSLGYIPGARRNFLIIHEFAHCSDTTFFNSEIDGVGKVWKEAYADMVAILVLRRNGVNSSSFKEVALLRGTTEIPSLSALWQDNLKRAVNYDIPSTLTDADLMVVAKNIRHDVFTEAGLLSSSTLAFVDLSKK